MAAHQTLPPKISFKKTDPLYKLNTSDYLIIQPIKPSFSSVILPLKLICLTCLEVPTQMWMAGIGQIKGSASMENAVK